MRMFRKCVTICSLNSLSRTLFSPKKVNYSHEENMNQPAQQPREMSEHDAIEQAWRDYHGPIKAEGEEDYFPALPPLFKRGFLYGEAFARLTGSTSFLMTPRTDNYKAQGREWLPLGIFEEVERENSRLREGLERIANCEGAPDIDATGEWQTGLHCGVEDRDCRDRYEGADYGHTVGVEKALEWASNEAKHVLSNAQGERRA